VIVGVKLAYIVVAVVLFGLDVIAAVINVLVLNVAAAVVEFVV
jgi:hypothetical protein